MAKITLISFASKVEGKRSRFAARNAAGNIGSKIKEYRNLFQTFQVVMTNQQHALTELLTLASRKRKIIADGRGRYLKGVLFPELAAVLNFCFW